MSGAREGWLPFLGEGRYMTTFPVKQGGLAAQQADRVGHTIATALGIPTGQFRDTLFLTARLLGGQRSLFLRTELDESGQPTGTSFGHTKSEEPAGVTKVFGHHLARSLEAREPVTPGTLV
jgi:hypothetical protein